MSDLPILTRALPVMRIRLVTPHPPEGIRQRVGDRLMVEGLPPIPLSWSAEGVRGQAGGLVLRGTLEAHDTYHSLKVWVRPTLPTLIGWGLAVVAFAVVGGLMRADAVQMLLLGALLLGHGLAMLAFQSRARAIDAHLRRVISRG